MKRTKGDVPVAATVEGSASPARGNIDMDELRRDLGLLLGLVNDPHPGLFTWRSMFYKRGIAIARNFCEIDPTTDIAAAIAKAESSGDPR